MEQFLNSIPKPLLVTVICALGVAFILMAEPQYTACTAQLEIFQKNMKADLFSRQGQVMGFSPRLAQQLSACKQGNGPGGCFELFRTSRKLIRELENFPDKCNADLAAIAEVRRGLESPMLLMAQVAWGEQPPEGPENRFRWFESPDLALYCQLRAAHIRLYGEEEFLLFQTNAGLALPGEAAEFKDGVCTNCKTRKSASAVLSPTEIWKRSIFSAACSQINY